MDHYEIVENSLRYIEENIQQPPSLEIISNRFHLSKYYFHRIFSAMMGCSLNQYILTRRLNASLPLIQNKALSLTDIAYELNFGTPSSFSRAFKRQYGVAPSTLREKNDFIAPVSIPAVVRRSIKNINGDLVANFTLTDFDMKRISGIAFEVDIATDDYKNTIRSHSNMLLDSIDETVTGPCYVIYSNCEPNSTRFKVLFGIPFDIQVNEPFYFTVDIPQIFCAKFNYSGDLLDIGDVLKTDYARFLKISKLETGASDIELIQCFDDIHQLDSNYHIYAPIKKLAIDSE